MTAERIRVSPALQKSYDEQYSDELTGWRHVGAKYKARNIMHLAEGYSFHKVLECGAGEGSILEILDQQKFSDALFAIEISDSGIRQIGKRRLPSLVEVRKFDGYEIPYADHEFDLVYCSHVLEHVEHPRFLLREIMRVGRHQIFEVPLDYSPHVDEKVEVLVEFGHINVFTPSTFKFLLKSEGFRIHRELLTDTAAEVVRYNWYVNMHLPKTLMREVILFAYPLLKATKRRVIGATLKGDFGYSAFSCLTTACDG